MATIAMTIARPAVAHQVAGVEFADSIRTESTQFRLNGVAVYRKFGVRVLAAGLWLEEPQRDAAAILHRDAPRRYVTHFLHGVSAKKIRSAWKEGLEANAPDAGADVRRDFERLGAWIHDFRSGEEISVTYVPGRGSLVEINGIRAGSISGKPFADAYFALALGPRPGLGQSFRKSLLGP
jgi:hypothetical protein